MGITSHFGNAIILVIPCLLWVMSGRRRLWQELSELPRQWSGAVTCPACLCGSEGAGHSALRGSGPNNLAPYWLGSNQSRPRSPMHNIEDATFPVGPKGAVRVRIVRPKDSERLVPVIMHFHGGGWVLGDMNTQRAALLPVSNNVGLRCPSWVKVRRNSMSVSCPLSSR